MYLSGYQYAQNGQYSFTYETKVKLKQGKNEISLLSGTVGLPVSNKHIIKTLVMSILMLAR